MNRTFFEKIEKVVNDIIPDWLNYVNWGGIFGYILCYLTYIH